jgi:uncharacterized protein (TIGR00255 family)
MTGFGMGQAALGEGRLTIELRALNHRYLDIRVRLPSEIADQTFVVEQLARERLSRGRFDVDVRLEGSALPAPHFDVTRARAAYRALEELRDELVPAAEVSLAALLSLPDVIVAAARVDSEALRRSLQQALEGAIGELDAMRAEEGEALERELLTRLSALRQLCGAVSTQSSSLVDGYRARLKERIERLLADASVSLDSGRLESEIAIFADRTDVTEELVRLCSHFDQIEKLFGTGGPIGRRLDFLLQEITREANTVGAKSQDAGLSHLIVEIKAEVERMREQVQNVE